MGQDQECVLRKVQGQSQRKGWRECEREFKATRDPKMRVTLPRVSILEKAESDCDRTGEAAA